MSEKKKILGIFRHDGVTVKVYVDGSWRILKGPANGEILERVFGWIKANKCPVLKFTKFTTEARQKNIKRALKGRIYDAEDDLSPCCHKHFNRVGDNELASCPCGKKYRVI